MEQDTMSVITNSHNVRNLITMFTDASAGESTRYNRLVTLELESGNVALIGYGEKVLAEYDESENHVTVYLGHKAGGNTTVTRWLNEVVEVSTARRSVTLSDNAPWFAPPNADAAQFIGNYVDFANPSAVDRDAVEKVRDSLRFLDDLLN